MKMLTHYLKNTREATIAGSAALLLSFGGLHTAQAQLHALPTRHTRDAVTQGQAALVQRLDANASLHLVIGLPVRDQASLGSFVKSLYRPASPNYRQFLSVEQFTGMFGPTEADYNGVRRWAGKNGFTVTGTASNRLIIEVDGKVADIEKAFNVTMGLYQHPTENRTFYAPDREPTVNLSVPLWHITGLDNFSIPRPASLAQDLIANPDSTGSGPGGAFLGSDFRAAYYGSGRLTGAGQSLGLLEYVGYNPDDVTKYFSTYGPPLTTTVTPISTDGTAAICTTCDDTEQALDIEVSISMAPAMDQVLVYVGSTDSSILNRMATDNIAKSISCSWAWRPADPQVDDPIFMEYAAQGQTFFTASGDSGSWSNQTVFSWPADSQNVVSVGGTHLVTDGAGGPWLSETAWSDSGGGISLNRIPIPDYQMNRKVVNPHNGASRTRRNAPDVAAEGDFDNWICYDGTCGGGWGGTSFAAPRWGGYLALANQQAASNGDPTLGFINPAIYQIGERHAYTNNFHDITSGTNGGFNAVTGFDLVTGWGSPNGPTLINTLTN